MSDEKKKRTLPTLEEYQKRCVIGGLNAFKSDKDVLIEAPTGAGKTPMIARLASESAKAGHRTLVLTHRKLLFGQMVGRPDADNEKKRLGEMAYWGGVKPGTIADDTLGGVNQNPALVVAMVETAAARLDLLEKYDRIIVDEAQHVSDKSATGDELGAYAKIIEALPDAKLAGLTATTFRGDKDKLHPRLENAHREIVGVDEARSAKRIVPARTVIGKARTKEGLTAAQLVQMEKEGRLGKRTASAVLLETRGEDYYDQAVQDWDTIAKREKTIIFVDSVAEVEDMTARLNEAYGDGVAVCLHGGKDARGKIRSPKQNADALKEYDGGEARVLVSCQMIGEGFDVPETNSVMSLNSSLSRLQMNQYVGRCVRYSKDKERGLFLDYGTASHYYGLIEHQHEMQNIEALAAAGTNIASSRVVGRMAPAQEGAWRAVPGDKNSMLIRSSGNGYEVYGFDHAAEKTKNKRLSKDHGATTHIKRLDDEEFGTKKLNTRQMAQVLSRHAKAEVEFYSRMGGVSSKTYENNCREMLTYNQDNIAKFEKTNAAYAKGTESENARREALAASLQGDAKGDQRGRMLKKALENAKSGMDMVRACLDLSGEVLSNCSNRPNIPLGITSEARAVSESLLKNDYKEMKPGAMRKEGLAAYSVMEHVSKNISDKSLQTSIGNVSDPLRAGIDRLTREMTAEKRRKKAQHK